MRSLILVFIICLFGLSSPAKEKSRITEIQAQAFLDELLIEAESPQAAQKKMEKTHPFLGLSLFEAGHAGTLSYVLLDGTVADRNRPIAEWCGEIFQNNKRVFGFRLRRNPNTDGVEIFHFWTIGVPHGLKEIRGFII